MRETIKHAIYAMMALYLLLMLAISLYGLKLKREGKDSVVTHFLGTKDYGLFIIFFNTVATFVSGYFVVGIPQEASVFGYVAMVWVGAG